MKRLIANKKRPSHKKWFVGVFVALLCVGAGVFHVLPPAPDAIEPPKHTKAGINERMPSKEEQFQYEVAPGMPRALYIDKIGIDGAKILPVGLEADGVLAAPDSIYDVGWYQNSVKPGSGQGAALLDGHVSGMHDRNGVFRRLKELVAGDKIMIEKGDKSKVVYIVRKIETQPLEKVDMAKLMRSFDPEREGLNLITCGGPYDYERELYEDRVMVYAMRET
jgi:LPXTG-site transpeptidase (sortase) family protein